MLVAAIMLAVLALAGRAPLRHAAAKLAGLGMSLLAGAYLGEWLLLWLQWGTWPTAGVEAILPRAFRWVPIAAVGAVILAGRQRALDLSSRLHQVEISRLQLDKEQVALQLQLLRSQIEPHFLFNTLATIRHLQRTDPARGHETLTGFIRYLKASLPAMRASETTLGQEMDLVRAYLVVLQVRMGDRLRFDIDLAQGLRDERIPPFSVATLVENAIKHGLAELPGGGSISISAWRDGRRLAVRVSDTGKGLAAKSGTGTGIANLMARLRGLYGEDGTLSLAANSPSGLVVTLQVPSHQPTAGDGPDAT
jgi:LytS/YehU family sensor histidine kinase